MLQRILPIGVLCLTTWFGCSSTEGDPLGTGGVGSSTGARGSGTGGNSGLVLDPNLPIPTGVGGGRTGNGTPEICDGLDNDDNGIIDDVDLGNDGVCDCLNIATVGQIGPWSNGGNIFADWLNARSPQGAVALDDEVLTPELLRPYQVLVMLHVATTQVTNGRVISAAHHAFSDAEVAVFEDWVIRGGGVMTTIGYTSDEAREVVNVNRLLTTVNMGYSTTRLDLDGYVTRWTTHPVTDGVSNILTDNGVEPAGFGSTVATTQNNQPALQVLVAGEGRVAVWGDEWITYDSEWADVQDQQVERLWLNLLKWLSPPNQCQVPIPPPVVQ
jgi:hypothetical protein